MTNLHTRRIPLAELARLYPNTEPIIIQDPSRSHSRWIDWAYVQGRAALKPCKALRVRSKVEQVVNIQKAVVPFRQQYESATNGRHPKPKKVTQPEPQMIVYDSIEGELNENNHAEVYGAPPDFATSFCMPSQSSQPGPSRKRKRCEPQKARKRMREISEEPSQNQIPEMDETFDTEPLPTDEETDQESSHIDQEVDQEPLRTPEQEALEKRLAGHAPDYSHIVDKKDNDASSFIDSEVEIGSEDERSCLNKVEIKKEPEKKPEKIEDGYETERIPTPEWEDMMEKHSQEWNSPEARAQRNAVLAKWAWEDQNGLFFGKPYGDRGRALYPNSQGIPTYEGVYSYGRPPIIAVDEEVDEGAEADDEGESNEVNRVVSSHSAVADRCREDTELL